MEDDLPSQLRRQISLATGEKESSKIELEGLKRTVDSHLLRLSSSLNAHDVSLDRLSVLIQAFDSDLRGRLDTGDASALRDGLPSEGTYEVLRQSLANAQRRSQELNGDMLRVADANEELMSTLKTLKGTNKRLVEEVQKQTEELSNLTQSRLLDMENLSRLEEAFRHEKVMWQQEAKRCIEDEQQQCEDEFNRMRDSHQAQLDECWRQAKMVAQKAGTLRMKQSELRTQVQGFAQTVGAQLKAAERDLQAKITAQAKEMHGEQTKLRDAEHNLQVRFRAERDVSERKTEAWRARHKALASELDELVGKRDRDVSELQAKTEAIQAKRDAEVAAHEADRSRLHEQVESNVKEVALFEAMMQTAKRKVLQLESRMAQAEGERDRLQYTADMLRQQIRESDEALSEAVRSNEALREQMEVQRLDAHNANERDLKLCREMFERRHDLLWQEHRNEQSDHVKRIRAAEEAIGLKAGDLQATKESLAQKTRQRDALQRDLLVWKSQHELGLKLKTEVDRDLSQFRHECLQGELQKLEENHDELGTRKADLELRRAHLVEEVQQVQQKVKARELADSEQTRVLAEQQREATVDMQRLKMQQSQLETALAASKAEAATTTQQMSERRDTLEQELTKLTADHEAEKRDFERKMLTEKSNTDSVRESIEKLRAEHHSSYRAAFEGPVQQISALEGAITDIQRSSDAELNNLRSKADKQRMRVDELETELARQQGKLEQTEHEVQEMTTRVNHSKSNQRSTRESLERDRNLKHEELQQIQRSIAKKSDELKSLTRAGEDARKRLLRDVEEAKAAKSRQLAESEQRLHGLRSSDYALALEDNRDGGYPAGVSSGPGPSRERFDNLFRDTEQLRRSMGESRPGVSMGQLTDIGGQVQRSLASMEDRAAHLRQDASRNLYGR